MKRNILSVLSPAALAFAALLGSRSLAATATIQLHSDNGYVLYHSTNDTIAGNVVAVGMDDNGFGGATILGTYYPANGYSWGQTRSHTVTLTPGLANYLHIAAVDQGGTGGFLAQVTLNGATFPDGSTFAVTGSPQWRASSSGFAGYSFPTSAGGNGVGPWGYQSDISPAARWIWSGDFINNNLAYFSIGFKETANRPPVARATNVAVTAGADCLAAASVNNGSSDPDGDPITLTQSPAGPYPIGVTPVTLTVTDSKGASSTVNATVTVSPGVTFTQAVPDIFPGTDFLTCLIGNFQEPTRVQNWKLRLRSGAVENVVLTVAATTVNTAETGGIEATVTDQTGLRTVTVVHPTTQGDNVGALSLTLQGGQVYDLAIRRTGQAAHYKLGSPDKRLEIGFGYPLLYLEHHEQAWVINAAPNEIVSIDVIRHDPPIGGAGPQATSMIYSVRRPDCTEVIPPTVVGPLPGTITFPAGPAGGPFVIFLNPDGHFALRRNSGCDGGFYAVPCPPHVEINCPPNIVVGTDPGRCTAVVNFAATVSGACGAGGITYSIAPGSEFPVGTTQVTASTMGVFGEPAFCTFSVTVEDREAPVFTSCPATIEVGTEAGQCSAVVDYALVATDNCGAKVTYSIAPGTVFPKGITPVTATATDKAGNQTTCTFNVVVNDTQAPVGTCVPTTNPAGGTVPGAKASAKAGQNPDGFYQLLGSDNCDTPDSLGIFLQDSASNYIAGPFRHGDKVKITQAPGVTPNTKPMAGVIVAHVQLKGDALLVVIDAAGNSSVVAACLVAPAPK